MLRRQPEVGRGVKLATTGTLVELIRCRLVLAAQARRAPGDRPSERMLDVINMNRYPTLSIEWAIRCEIDGPEVAQKVR